MTPPVVDHPVIGFRAWKVNDGAETFLRSIVQDSGWDRLNEAECKRPFHLHRDPAPADGCECGLYAFHDYQTALGYAHEAQVVGIVRGWGSLRVHKDGWRSQHAEVLAIIKPAPTTSGPWIPSFDDQALENAREAAKRYQVPLIPASAVDTMAGEFGKVVPEEIRPASSIYSGVRGMSFGEEMVSVAVVFAPIFAAIASLMALEWARDRRRSRRGA